MFRKYLLYLLRWQLSTPILAACVIFLSAIHPTWRTIVANVIGGLIFFWVDRWIFNRTNILRGELWETQFGVVCADCGKEAEKGYRLVKAPRYDRTYDRKPEFRCHECSRAKYAGDRATRKADRAALRP